MSPAELERLRKAREAQTRNALRSGQTSLRVVAKPKQPRAVVSVGTGGIQRGPQQVRVAPPRPPQAVRVVRRPPPVQRVRVVAPQPQTVRQEPQAVRQFGVPRTEPIKEPSFFDKMAVGARELAGRVVQPFKPWSRSETQQSVTPKNFAYNFAKNEKIKADMRQEINTNAEKSRQEIAGVRAEIEAAVRTGNTNPKAVEEAYAYLDRQSSLLESITNEQLKSAGVNPYDKRSGLDKFTGVIGPAMHDVTRFPAQVFIEGQKKLYGLEMSITPEGNKWLTGAFGEEKLEGLSSEAIRQWGTDNIAALTTVVLFGVADYVTFGVDDVVKTVGKKTMKELVANSDPRILREIITASKWGDDIPLSKIDDLIEAAARTTSEKDMKILLAGVLDKSGLNNVYRVLDDIAPNVTTTNDLVREFSQRVKDLPDNVVKTLNDSKNPLHKALLTGELPTNSKKLRGITEVLDGILASSRGRADEAAELVAKKADEVKAVAKAPTPEAIRAEEAAKQGLSKGDEIKPVVDTAVDETGNIPKSAIPEGEAPNKVVQSMAESGQVSEAGQKVISQIEKTHPVKHNVDVVARAQARVDGGRDEALEYAVKNQNTDEGNSTMIQLFKGVKDEREAFELGVELMNRGLEAGRATQIFKTMKSFDAEGAAVQIAKSQRKALSTSARESLDKAQKTVPAAMNKVNEEVGEAVAETISKKITGKIKAATTKIGKKLAPEEKLANRIKSAVKPGKKGKPDVMVNELSKIARKVLDIKKTTIPKDPADIIRQGINEFDEMKRVWTESKDILKGKLDPKDWKLVDDFFQSDLTKPYAQSRFNRLFSQTKQSMELNMRELVKEHFTVVNRTKEELVEQLVNSVGVSKKQAEQLANDAYKMFDAEATKAKKSILKQFTTKTSTKKGSQIDRLIGLSNAGALDDIAARARISEMWGIRQMTPEETATIKRLAENVAKAPEGMAKDKAKIIMLKEMSKFVDTPTALKVSGVWKGMLLAAVDTFSRNVLSSASAMAAETIKDIPAAMFDTVRHAITGQARAKTQAIGKLDNSIKAFFGSWNESKELLTKGIDMRHMLEKFDHQIVNFSDTPKGKVGDFFANKIPQFMGAQDLPFYNFSYARSVVEQTKLAWINSGKQGDLGEMILRQLAAPSDDIALQATQDAAKAVFQNDTLPAALLASLKRTAGQKGGPEAEAIAEFLVPFTRTPSALAIMLLDYTPGVGAIMGGVRRYKQGAQANRYLAEQMGRQTVGVGTVATGYLLYKNGDVHLLPKDRDEANEWAQQGIKPFSVTLGSVNMSLGSFGALEQTIFLGAMAAQAQEDGDNVATETFNGLLKMFSQQPFIEGLGDAAIAIANPDKEGGRWLERFIASWVPRFVEDIAIATDPSGNKREIDGVVDAVQARIPGARANLPEREDKYGQPVPMPATRFTDFADPFKTNLIGEPTIPEGDKLAQYASDRDKAKEEEIDPLASLDEEYQKIIGTIGESEEKLKDALEADVITQEQFDTIMNTKRAFKSDKEKDVPENISQSAMATLNKYNRLSDKGREKYFEGHPDSYAKTTAKRINQIKAEDLPDFKANNSMGFEYAMWEKKYKNAEGNPIEQDQITKNFWDGAVKSQFEKTVQESYAPGIGRIYDQIDKGNFRKPLVDKMIEMDNMLVQAGVLSSPKFSNKWRREHGYTTITGTGKGGSGGGSKTKARIVVPKITNLSGSISIPKIKATRPRTVKMSTKHRPGPKPSVSKIKISR